MNKHYENLLPHMERLNAYSIALTMLSWDSETQSPENSNQNTSKAIGTLAAEQYQILINDEMKDLLSKLNTKEEMETLSLDQAAIVKKLMKSIEQTEAIPADEFREFKELIANSSRIWAKAKQNNNFDEFAPTLTKVLETTKKFTSYRAKENQDLYDLLLDDNEEGFTSEYLTAFFTKIKEHIVPLLKKIIPKNDLIDKSFNTLKFPVDKQKEFNHFIAEYVGFNFSCGVIAESEHPFTTHFHNHDVRFTTHYYEDNLESAIFSTIHESGHGIYEQNISDQLTMTPVGCGASMGAHESQSRFFENIIGRSEAFWTPIWDRLRGTFSEQLSSISLSQFIRAINKAEPSLIRTEADELTYTLHIIIRYELERAYFHNEITVEELPEQWNKKYKEYLNITPPDMKQGILQDTHWSSGLLGYFPSYALGSAIAAQIYYHLLDIMPFEQYLLEGNLTPIRTYLKEHFHRYGATKTTNEILKEMMGEPLNVDYYLRYLEEKYTKLYCL